jgi:hypothetical protein
MPSGCQKVQACQLCCSLGILNLLHSASCMPPHGQVNLRFHTLLLCGCREASLSTEHEGPVLPTTPSCSRAPAALSKSRNPALPLSGNLQLCRCQETCFLWHIKSQHSILCPTMVETPHCYKAMRMPDSPLRGGKL